MAMVLSLKSARKRRTSSSTSDDLPDAEPPVPAVDAPVEDEASAHAGAEGGRRGDEIISRQMGVQDLDILADEPSPQARHAHWLEPVHQGQRQHLNRPGRQLAAQPAVRADHAGDLVTPAAHPDRQVHQADLSPVIAGHRAQVGNAHGAPIPNFAAIS